MAKAKAAAKALAASGAPGTQLLCPLVQTSIFETVTWKLTVAWQTVTLWEQPVQTQMKMVLARTAGASTSSALGAGATGIDAAMAELDMEHYDSEDGGAAGPKVNLFGSGKAYYRGSREDPYLKGGGAGDPAEDSDDDASERDELHLRPSDLLILSARNEDDVSHLEVRRGLRCAARAGAGMHARA